MTQVSLEELAKSAATCDRCELCRSRANVVFGEGDPETPMLLIGEGPGETEDATGARSWPRRSIAGQGPAGKQIRRKHVYITNIIKCARDTGGERTCSEPSARVANQRVPGLAVTADRPH